MKTAFVIVVGLFLVGGCANARTRLTELSVGMSKDDALRIMGKPDSKAAKDGVEYLKYVVNDEWEEGYARPYYVRIINGKVESYGRIGDFDSTKDPVLNVNIKK